MWHLMAPEFLLILLLPIAWVIYIGFKNRKPSKHQLDFHSPHPLMQKHSRKTRWIFRGLLVS
ncbi:MAG: hypothetical protein ACKOA8_07265, partial [Deltaproteobacteria bacterium]